LDTPVSQPQWTFSYSGDENFYRNPNRDKNSIVPELKISSGDGFGQQIFALNFKWKLNQSQFPSEAEIVRYFLHRGRNFGRIFQWGWGLSGSVTQGCIWDVQRLTISKHEAQ